MLSKSDVERVAEIALNSCDADEVEVSIGSGASYLTRYADNHIHQNNGVSSVSVTVTAVIGQKMAEASTNSLAEKDLIKAARNARELAELSPPDPDLLPRVGKQEYRQVDSYFDERIMPDQRAEAVERVVSLASSRGCVAAGVFSNSYGSTAMVNSAGLFAYHRSSNVMFSASVMADPDGSGWAEVAGRRPADLDVDSVAETAVRKAEMSRNARAVTPGRYTVILEPAATSTLPSFLARAFDALSVDEGRSPIADKIGTRIFGENINLFSDIYHPLHQGRPFDAEGVPTRAVQLVKDGVINDLVYDRVTAKKHGVEPTGHGTGKRSSSGAYPRGIVMTGGETSLDDMIANSRSAILVTRFHYENMVSQKDLVITGMTRDGTFMIENGEIAYPIKNMRFNVSLFDVLNRVVEMSEPVFARGMVVPAVKIDGFTFTSATSF